MTIYVLLLMFVIAFRLVQSGGKVRYRESYEIKEIDRSRKDKQFIIASFAFVILITALRSINVGPDTPQYVGHFYRTCNGIYYVLDEHFEWGYKALELIISKITHNEQVLLAIIALLTNIPMGRLIFKYSNNIFLSVILYITIGSFTFQLTGLRQAIAMAICAIAIDYAFSRKLIPFICLVLLAALFHKSAIMFFPAYFCANPRLNRRSFLLIILSFVGVFFASTLFIKVSALLNYQEYVGTIGVEGKGGWSLVVIMSISLLLYFLLRKTNPIEEQSENKERFFFILLLIGLTLYVIRYQVRVAERMSLYYRTALVILLPNSLTRIKKGEVRLFFEFFCALMAIALFFYWLQDSWYVFTPFWSA